MSDLEELLTAKEVCKKFKLGRTTLWRWVKAGIFPAPRLIGPNCTRWLKSEVGEWLANGAPARIDPKNSRTRSA